ncbi:MAG: type III secretion system stator protein SctL [Myxococcota bacterium]
MEDGPRDEKRPSANVRVSKVIKGDAAPDAVPADRLLLRPPRPGVLNAEEFEARTNAQKIIEDAERKKQEILDEANRQREEIFEKARDEARAEVAAQASAELAKAKMQAGQIIAGAEQQIVQLALKVAEKIIGQDLERDPEVLLRICATAMENVRQANAMVLKVNPKDGRFLREKRAGLMELLGRTLDLSIKDDSDVEPGGCIIQTEFGTIDAQLKTQYEMLKNVLVPDTGKKEPK